MSKSGKSGKSGSSSRRLYNLRASLHDNSVTPSTDEER